MFSISGEQLGGEFQLNTRLHLPDETRTVLELFKDEFEKDSHKANAFYACDDFAELAKRLGLVMSRLEEIS